MSEVKVNKLSPRLNCGTVTLGDSGDSFVIPSGVTITNNGTQTGFGRTGTVDWDTTAKTAGFTAVSGTGYFVNTTSGSITMNLPATPSAGDIVSIKDYAYTFGTNNFIVDGNGSPIGGTAGTIPVTYSTNGTSKTFVYVDGTKGWLVTNESTDTSQEQNAQFVTATGGTVTCCGDYKIHTFTGPGTFCVTCAGNPSGSTTVDYLVVAGGGGGGGKVVPANFENGGGGGAGGYRESSGAASGCYTVSPLGSGVSALPVTVTGYPITVGGGGAGGSGSSQPIARGSNGSNSIFSSITSAGGGAGGGNADIPGGLGGSEGGSGGGNVGHQTCQPQKAGNTPPVSPPQGQPGGLATTSSCNNSSGGSGGGGATAAGGNNPTPTTGGAGGAGATSSINGTPTGRAGGGGAAAGCGPATGTDGGGNGGWGGGDSGASGTANTGGGGGGSGPGPAVGGSGGSGIVIIRYKYQ